MKLRLIAVLAAYLVAVATFKFWAPTWLYEPRMALIVGGCIILLTATITETRRSFFATVIIGSIILVWGLYALLKPGLVVSMSGAGAFTSQFVLVICGLIAAVYYSDRRPSN